MSTALGYRTFGGPEVQEYFDRPDPVPGPTEVAVRVAAAGVNPMDHVLRSGHAQALNGAVPFPQVLGFEAAGTVTALGSEVSGLAVGDRVTGFAMTGAGTYSATTLLLGESTARIPDALPATWAATIPIAGTTALDLLDQLDLPARATLLVNGIGGGVGIALAQLARARDLSVTGTAGPAKRDLVAGIGATFVDYTQGDVVGRLRAQSQGGCDAVVDTVGGDSLRAVAELAVDRKRLISVGDYATVDELGGSGVQRRYDRDGLQRVAELMVSGKLDPHITATYPLARAAEALALVESRHATGKLVIDLTL